MVLGELGSALAGALRKLGEHTVVDEEVMDACLKEVGVGTPRGCHQIWLRGPCCLGHQLALGLAALPGRGVLDCGHVGHGCHRLAAIDWCLRPYAPY
jgi:hypothetical protein